MNNTSHIPLHRQYNLVPSDRTAPGTTFPGRSDPAMARQKKNPTSIPTWVILQVQNHQKMRFLQSNTHQKQAKKKQKKRKREEGTEDHDGIRGRRSDPRSKLAISLFRFAAVALLLLTTDEDDNRPRAAPRRVSWAIYRASRTRLGSFVF